MYTMFNVNIYREVYNYVCKKNNLIMFEYAFV